MRNRLAMLLAVTVVLSLAAPVAQAQSSMLGRPALLSTNNGPSDAFQVRYASNLNIGDSVINITNAGSQNADATGNICANVYVFSPDEQMIACCSCVVTPNGLVNLSAQRDLISNTLTPAVPSAIVVKLLATRGTCNAATPTASRLAPGMRAWGTTLHATNVADTYAVTETEFSPATLSSTELATLTSECGFIQQVGSGYGICRSCRLGGL